MKYIRTKDGNILERKEELGHFYYENREITSYYYNEQNNLSLDDFLKERGGIIKQADNIEELCDEFVGVVGNMHRQLTGTNIRSWNDCAIYGAIWTDKGLIYVAKMNDKGELELL